MMQLGNLAIVHEKGASTRLVKVVALQLKDGSRLVKFEPVSVAHLHEK
jgi:hypothetical protein